MHAKEGTWSASGFFKLVNALYYWNEPTIYGVNQISKFIFRSKHIDLISINDIKIDEKTAEVWWLLSLLLIGSDSVELLCDRVVRQKLSDKPLKRVFRTSRRWVVKNLLGQVLNDYFTKMSENIENIILQDHIEDALSLIFVNLTEKISWKCKLLNCTIMISQSHCTVCNFTRFFFYWK